MTSFVFKTRRPGLSLEHLEFDFHDEGDDCRFDQTRHLLLGDGLETEWEIKASNHFGSSHRFHKNVTS